MQILNALWVRFVDDDDIAALDDEWFRLSKYWQEHDYYDDHISSTEDDVYAEDDVMLTMWIRLSEYWQKHEEPAHLCQTPLSQIGQSPHHTVA